MWDVSLYRSVTYRHVWHHIRLSLECAFSVLLFIFGFVLFLFYRIHLHTEAICFCLLCRLRGSQRHGFFFLSFRNTVFNLHIVLVQGSPLDFCVSDISCSPFYFVWVPTSDSQCSTPPPALPGLWFSSPALWRRDFLLKNTTAFFSLKKKKKKSPVEIFVIIELLATKIWTDHKRVSVVLLVCICVSAGKMLVPLLPWLWEICKSRLVHSFK